MNTYRIADLLVNMETFGRTRTQSEPYRVEFTQDADITIHSEAEALRRKHPYLSQDESEYLSTGACFFREFPRFDGMMLHASCVVVEERAYLFSAPCGTGKSTHTSLWLELFGDRAYILNDDKPAIRCVDDDIYVYGAPWSGKTDRNVNTRVKLGGICVLQRGAENRIAPLGGAQAVFALINQSARSSDPLLTAKLLQVAGRLVESGKVYSLLCNMELAAARLSYEYMSGKRFVNENETGLCAEKCCRQ